MTPLKSRRKARARFAAGAMTAGAIIAHRSSVVAVVAPVTRSLSSLCDITCFVSNSNIPRNLARRVGRIRAANRNRPPNRTEVTMGTRREDYCYGQTSFMRADEWVGKELSVYIEAIEDVQFEQGLKPVLRLRGQEKGLVVNATNFDLLADAFGSNPSKWAGSQHHRQRRESFVQGQARRLDPRERAEAVKAQVGAN
jgi:hypothetical protein